jgi:glycosyltransferase involved in cell wall biosynthesis
MTLVSVVIPCFNGERFLGEALTSVLAQTHRDLAVLVGDDGSRDGSLAIARGTRDRRVRVVCQENGGVAAARNLGAAEARGEYLAFLDQDDAWCPGKLERQLRCFTEEPRSALVYTDCLVVDEHGTLLYRWSARNTLYSGSVFEQLIPESVVPLSTILLRRRTFEAVGGFRAFRYVEDLDLILRILMHGALGVVREPLARYRLHAESTSRVLGIDVATEEVLTLCRELMERHAERRTAIRTALGRYLYAAGKAAFYQGRTELAARYLSESDRQAPSWRTREFARLMCAAPGVVLGIRRLVKRLRRESVPPVAKPSGPLA